MDRSLETLEKLRLETVDFLLILYFAKFKAVVILIFEKLVKFCLSQLSKPGFPDYWGRNNSRLSSFRFLLIGNQWFFGGN